MEITVWNACSEAERRQLLARPALEAQPQLRVEVARYLEQVLSDGDATLRALTRRFDAVELDQLRVAEADFARAEVTLEEPLKHAMRQAHARLHAFHAAGAPQPYALDTAPGVRCERLPVALECVGLYVPAGTAPLPSTALMLGVPASLAGCARVVLCSPPNRTGELHATVLYAAQLCGITEVYRLGGVQAIGAMAYGTQSVPKCDKLFGPGNAYVTMAKQLVAEDPHGAAIDMAAGPSEVLVIADALADAEIVAADLLSQAEHGADSQVVLISDCAALLEQVLRALNHQCAALPRHQMARAALGQSRFILVDQLAEAVTISNRYAPEHLLLNVAQPRGLLAQVRHAGSVFLGRNTPESVGDYNSGTNHVLPTYGQARANSGVSVLSFVKFMTVQELSPAGLAEIGPETMLLARAEGLEAHARAVEIRLQRAAR